MVKSFFDLIKVRITMLVLTTAYLGFYLGQRYQGSVLDIDSSIILVNFLFGTFFTSSGACVLNQYIESDEDSMMDRTKNRPIPSGKIKSSTALILGVAMSLFGVYYLYIMTNPTVAILSFTTIFLYIFIYTPSKKISVWNTLIGSVPGAIPPIGGWCAATNSFDIGPGWLLFGILFCWQIPHFFAISVICANDYNKAGFRMLPSLYPESKSVGYIIVFFSVSMICTSIGIYIYKLAGMLYAISSAILGIIFLVYTIRMFISNNTKNARALMFASIVYLPMLLIFILLERFLS